MNTMTLQAGLSISSSERRNRGCFFVIESSREKAGFALIDEVRVKNCRTKELLVDALERAGFAVDVMGAPDEKEPSGMGFVLTVYRREASTL